MRHEKQRVKMELSREAKLIKGLKLKGVELVRICNPDKKHYNYEWHDGENIDILPFQAKGECLPGGLYFTTLENLLCFADYYNYLGDHWFVRVTVDDNEDVWQEDYCKCKAHRVMVTSMTRIKDLPEEVLYRMAMSFLHYRYIWSYQPFDPVKREELWHNVIVHKPHFLQFVQNPTDKMVRTAINQNSKLINWVHDPIQLVTLADELNAVSDITNWSCDLINAFLASGKYTFKWAGRYEYELVLLTHSEVVRKSDESDDYYYGRLCLVIYNSDNISRGLIRDPSREMIDLVLGLPNPTPTPLCPCT